MTTLSINLFGSTRVFLDDDPAPDLPGKKVAALLYYLAAEQPAKHQREALMALLWPGMPKPAGGTEGSRPGRSPTGGRRRGRARAPPDGPPAPRPLRSAR